MSKTDGGLAFPSDGPDGTPGYSGGMSLRDWFAGQALASVITDVRFPETAAKHAYSVADAMLKEHGHD